MATSKLRAGKPADFITSLKEAEKVYTTAEKPSDPGQVEATSGAPLGPEEREEGVHSREF